MVRPDAVIGTAVASAERKDEVKLSTALQKILEEDPSLYQYDDRYDAGAQPQAPAGQAAAPTEEVNDIDAANLGIFDRN